MSKVAQIDKLIFFTAIAGAAIMIYYFYGKGQSGTPSPTGLAQSDAMTGCGCMNSVQFG